MKAMDIYIADVPFDDIDKSKVRPALVVKISQNRVNVFKITSKYKNKSNVIKQLYYPIKEWKSAGLSKPSYVDTHRTYNLPQEKIFAKKPLGKLSDIDRIQLFEFIQAKLGEQKRQK